MFVWSAKKYKTTCYTCESEIEITSPEAKYKEILKYGLVLDKITQNCLNAVVDEKTLFVIKWAKELEQTGRLKKIYKENPDDVSILIKLANTSVLLFDHKKANKYIDHIMQLQPNHIEMMELQGTIEVNKKSFKAQSVADVYDKLVSRQPEEIRFLRSAAISNLDIDNPKGPDYARQLLHKCQKEVRLHQAMYNYYFRKQQYNNAIETLRKLKDEL